MINIFKSSALWTLPMLCLGLALLACCTVLPQVEENRQLVYEREKLQRDLAQLDKQADTNKQFLDKLGKDTTLAERLAQRQMKMVRSGSDVLEVKDAAGENGVSPFQLVTVPPPEPLVEFKPTGGLAALFIQKRTSTYIMGVAFMMIAAGLILGASGRENSTL